MYAQCGHGKPYNYSCTMKNPTRPPTPTSPPTKQYVKKKKFQLTVLDDVSILSDFGDRNPLFKFNKK